MDPIPLVDGLLPAQRYRLPGLLQDIRLLDLLELSGTTAAAGGIARVSQPTVSRRTSALARDFALVADRRGLDGCRCGTSPVMRLLRLGCRAHRLTAGVARLGADVLLQPLLAGHGWLLPAPPRFRRLDGWRELVRQGVLDGALVSGLEFGAAGPPVCPDLELLPLGAVPIELATAAGRGAEALATVLVPPAAVAPALQAALAERGLRLRPAGDVCQTPGQWLERLEHSPLAMPLPALEPADWWQPLRRWPLPEPLLLPLWLVLPGGWRQERVLARTLAALGRHPGLVRG